MFPSCEWDCLDCRQWHPPPKHAGNDEHEIDVVSTQQFKRFLDSVTCGLCVVIELEKNLRCDKHIGIPAQKSS
jgi:hypothetical protein